MLIEDPEPLPRSNVIALVSDNKALGARAYAIIRRLQGVLYVVPPEHFKHAAGLIRYKCGPWPRQPAGVLIDVMTTGIRAVSLYDEFTKSHPPVRAELISPATQAGAYKRATLAGSKTIHGVIVQEDDDHLVEVIQEMLYPRQAPEDDHVHRLKGQSSGEMSFRF